MGNKQEQSLFIYRPVQAESKQALLDARNQASRSIPRENRTVGSRLHATVFAFKGIVDYEAARYVVETPPETVAQPVTLAVKGVRYVHSHRTIKQGGLQVDLEDVNGIWTNEHLTFLHRAKQVIQSHKTAYTRVPHITLMLLSPEYMVTSTLRDIEERLPETISLEPALALPCPIRLANGKEHMTR